MQADGQQAVFDVAAPQAAQAQLHHQDRAVVPGVPVPLEISQSEFPAAFHSAVNDGARFLICLIFRSKHFPRRRQWERGGSRSFPRSFKESRRCYRGSFLDERHFIERTCRPSPATVCGRDGRPAATTGDVVDGWVRNHLPNRETFEMLRRSPPMPPPPLRHQGRCPCQLSLFSPSLTGPLSFRAGYRSAPPA
jgi:hypothetical protein